MTREEAEQELDLAIRTVEELRVEFRELMTKFVAAKADYLPRYTAAYLAIKGTARGDGKPHTDEDAKNKANQSLGQVAVDYAVLEVQYKAKVLELEAVRAVLSGRQTQMRVVNEEDKMETFK